MPFSCNDLRKPRKTSCMNHVSHFVFIFNGSLFTCLLRKRLTTEILKEKQSFCLQSLNKIICALLCLKNFI